MMFSGTALLTLSVSFLVATVRPACAQSEPPDTTPFPHSVETVGQLPNAKRVREYATSDAHERIVYAVRREGRWQIWQAGEEEPLDSWEGRRPLMLSLSPQGKRCAYVRRAGPKHELVVDGLVRDTAERYGSFVWSQQKGRFGCLVQDHEGQEYVHVDGERSPRLLFLMDQSLSFSPNGEHYTFLASTGLGMTAFLDGKPGEEVFPLAGWGAPIWNATSTQFAYDVIMAPRSKRRMVVNNESIGEFRELQRPVWDPTGQRLAFPFGQTSGPIGQYMIDGEPGPRFDALGKDGLAWSPEGDRHAYIARVGKQRGMVVDGKMGTLYDDAIEARFSPDGQRVACWVIHKNAWHLLLDGKLGPRFGERGSYVPGSKIFSPNSQEVAYAAREPGRAYIIRGTQKGPHYDRVAPYGARFDPSGQHVVCAFQKDKTWGLDVNGTFYPAFDRVWNDGQLAFHEDGSVTVLGQKGSEVRKLRVQLKGS